MHWRPPRGGVWRPLWRFAVLVLGATLPRLYGFRVRGRGHVPATGGVLVVSNHVADVDPPFVGYACRPRPPLWIALARHFERLPMALLLFGLGGFPLRTDGPDPRAMRHAREQLLRGRLVVIFPEGGPRWGGPLGSFHEGVGHLALTPGVAVVPAALRGTERVMRGRLPIGRGPVTLAFGPPVDVPREGSRRDRAAAATERARAAVAELLGEGPGSGG